MVIIPVAVTRVNWDALNAEVKSITGTSLSRPLDTAGISINDLVSLPLVLRNDAEAKYDMIRRQPFRLDYIHMALGVKTVTNIIPQIRLYTRLKAVQVTSKVDSSADNDVSQILTLIDGSLLDWVNGIKEFLLWDGSASGSVIKEFATKAKNFIKHDLSSPQLFDW
jgi:hypothetical protein